MFCCLMFNLIVFIIRFFFRCWSFDLLILVTFFTHNFPQVNNVPEPEPVSVWYLLCFYLTTWSYRIQRFRYVTLPIPTLGIKQFLLMSKWPYIRMIFERQIWCVHCSLHRLNIFVSVFSYFFHIIRFRFCVYGARTTYITRTSDKYQMSLLYYARSINKIKWDSIQKYIHISSVRGQILRGGEFRKFNKSSVKSILFSEFTCIFEVFLKISSNFRCKEEVKPPYPSPRNSTDTYI